MEALACSIFSRNVRDSACGLNPNLSSGKSSAIMISFRPISFHCSSTACEGLGAGFGGSFFAASCATAGSIANPIAKAHPATHLSFFIFLSSVTSERRTYLLSDVPLRQAFPPDWLRSTNHDQHRTALRYLAFRGGSSYAVKPSSSCEILNPAW